MNNQGDFLFTDSDPKQRGVGCDKMGTKKDGLKLKWEWWTGKPSQVCSAKAGNFIFEVIFWHLTYEARLGYFDNTLISKGHGGDNKNKILTRLKAQKIAENLLLEHYEYTGKTIAYQSKTLLPAKSKENKKAVSWDEAINISSDTTRTLTAEFYLSKDSINEALASEFIIIKGRYYKIPKEQLVKCLKHTGILLVPLTLEEII